MAAIDDAIKSYQDSLDDATNRFISDTQELEDEGLSTEEILAILAALGFAEYFVEALGLSTGINAYMAATETVLADLPFFGTATETQLLALQNIQRFNIESLTRYVSSTMRSSMAQGILNRLDKFEMEDLSSFRKIVVHFRNQEDIDKFAELIGQKITKAPSLWYPEWKKRRYADKRYVDES